MAERRLLIAVDAFGDGHIRALAAAVRGWASWERLVQDASPQEYRSALAGADMLIGWPEPEWLADSGVGLLLLPSAGYEEYLTPQLARLSAAEGLVACNAAGVYSEAVAEHCVAMMMALVRRLPEYVAAMRRRRWRQLHMHDRLMGATACVIGLGSLGSAIARRAAALGMRVVGVRRRPNRPSPEASEVFGPGDLRAAVAGADHVVAALPGGAATEGLVSREVVTAMKPGSYFYNVGRGTSVDEAALVERLRDGSLAGAGLDVFAVEPLADDSPMWGMENVIVTPHMAGYTWDFADELCELFAANLAAYRAGEPLRNVIDLSLAAPGSPQGVPSGELDFLVGVGGGSRAPHGVPSGAASGAAP